MDLLALARDLIALSFVQGVIAGLLVLALARAALVVLGSRDRLRHRAPRIAVVGVGGGGSNAVDSMIRAGARGVDFVAVNTDAQALRQSLATKRIQLGKGTLHGTGTGGNMRAAAEVAQADTEEIAAAVAGCDFVFVLAGLGGGTGSGAAPVVASIARESGALTIAVVTRPFGFEGLTRRSVADQAGENLRDAVDALITVPNDLVRETLPPGGSMRDALRRADDVLRQTVQGVIDLVAVPGLINLDAAHVRAVLKDGGRTVMGVGRGRGENRAVDAVRAAVATARFDDRMSGATRILLNVMGSSNLTLDEVTEAVAEVQAFASPEANVVFGASFHRRLRDEVVVTVIATAFEAARPSVSPRTTPIRSRKPETVVVTSLAPDPNVMVTLAPIEASAAEIAAMEAARAETAEPGRRRRLRLPAVRTNGV